VPGIQVNIPRKEKKNVELRKLGGPGSVAQEKTEVKIPPRGEE